MSPEQVFGWLNVHKPSGPTSHDVVAMVRRGTGVRKVGHAGTLDPMADGVLVLCLGPATRLSAYAMRAPKRYRARVRLGVTTDTYDAQGRVVEERSAEHLTPGQVEAALDAFRGEIKQVPPMYSALKREGRRLYNLARDGQEVPRDPRPVAIYHLALTAFERPFLTLDVECSPGTYIRSLAHDLGRALGVGGHLVQLTRVSSGAFHLDDAVSWDELRAAMADGSWKGYMLPPDVPLAGLPAVMLGAAEAGRVRHGQAIPAPLEAAGEARAYDPAGRLLAILNARDGQWQPVTVFLGAD